MDASGPHIALLISRSDTEELEVKELIEKAAPLIWTTAEPKDFSSITIKRFYLSTSNRVYKCSLGRKHAMVRVYGDGASLLVDRDHEVRITRMLCKFNLSAHIYCSFDNGYIVAYIEGNAVELEHLSDPYYSKLVAEKVADWHCALPPIPPPSTPPTEKRGVWTTIYSWLAIAERTVPPAQLEIGKREIVELEARLSVTYAALPLVMCHNDLNYGNVLYNTDAGCPEHERIAFVDYEYAGYNFRGFDLGNHFNEFGGLKLDFSKYPSRDTRRDFLRHYVSRCTELKAFSGDAEHEVERLLQECGDFAQVSHLFWHVWALVIAHTPDKPGEFDYDNYAALRLQEYFARKSSGKL